MRSLKNSCLYCGSAEIKTYKIINDYIIYSCNKCHLLFTGCDNEGEIASINKEWYSDAYMLNYQKKVRKLKRRFAQKVHELEILKRGGSLLDLGCGVGLFLEALSETAQYKWKLFGLDINEKLIGKAKVRLRGKTQKLFLGKVTSLNLKGEAFDCVTCFDVLEHDHELKLTLSEIKRLLKSSGLLLIQAPNYFSVMAYLCGERWDWWAVPDHVFHFNPDSLSLALQKEGFRIKKLYTWDPREEFISNIRGSIKARLGARSLIGRLASRCLYIPLLLLWGLLAIIERKFNIGSLLVILAEV